MKFYFVSIITLSLIACSDNQQVNDSKKDSSAATIETPLAPVAQMECFAYNSAKDTITLNLTGKSDDVKGTLLYALAEKDRNSGAIEGKYHGDTLVAKYTFMSEGKSSVRQVAFLKTADGMVEGYGDSEEKNGEFVFKNLSALNFGGKMVLSKINCP